MLVKQTLIDDFKTALDDIETMNKQEGITPEQVKLAFATKWAEAVNKFVTSGEVIFPPQAIKVATTGSSTNQSGGNPNAVKTNIQ